MEYTATRARVARSLVWACFASCWLTACGDNAATPPGQRPPPSVSVVTLETGQVTLRRELPGRTRAYMIAEVRPQVTGIVRERLFEEGSHVEQGQPLYQLDDATYRAEFQSAEASVARAEAAVEVARLNAGRAEGLRKSNAISDQDYQNLLAVRRQAEADLEFARAQLATARVRLDFARIQSPISGRAGRSTVTAGALVTADQPTALTTIQQLDPIYVDVQQSATELLALRRQLSETALRKAEDIPVSIVLDDGSRHAHEGILTFEDVAVDPATGSVAMRVVVPNPDFGLLPGMYVRAVVSNAIIDDALLVPQRGITHDARGRAVAMLLNDEGIVEERVVSIGDAIGSDWLVEDGLAAGDRVIVEGLQKIRVGQPAVVAGGAGSES
jgi:membrane fusion protein (multidrug efflux system)